VAENLYISNSEKEKSSMPLFIFKAVLFVAMHVPVVVFIGHKYSVASTENQINTYNQCRWDEFYSLPKNSIDMVYLGSSHSYCTFDPEIVD
jgi:hypothetical protein